MENIYKFLNGLEKGEHILRVECTKNGKEKPFAVYFRLGEVVKKNGDIAVYHSKNPVHKVIGYTNFNGSIDDLDYRQENVEKNPNLFTLVTLSEPKFPFGPLDEIITGNGKALQRISEITEKEKALVVLRHNLYAGPVAKEKAKLE
jgi:hypothetical protein